MAPSRPRSLRPFAFGNTNSTKRQTSPGPPSPTFSEATTHASAMNFGSNGPTKIITRTNLKASVQAYEDLIDTCANYRAALLTMSKATAGFADALERCSTLKGPTYEAGTRLQAASGLHHLIGNLWHVLSDTLDNSFEKPLRQHLESYRVVINERSQSYERALREKSQIIRDTERRSMNKKERNLQSFREALNLLQRQIDSLDELKASHYQEIVEHEEEAWDVVQNKARNGYQQSPHVIRIPDPFDSYGPPQAEDQIFSILAPLSIMSSNPSTAASPLTGSTPEHDSRHPLPNSTSSKITSWLPGTNGTLYTPETSEWTAIAPPTLTPPLSSSPTSSASPSSPPSTMRRHSVPSPSRKAESKLRSVLSVIEETKPRSESDTSTPSGPSLPPTGSRASSTAKRGELGLEIGYDYSYHESSFTSGEDGQLTPRNSTLFSPQIPTARTDSPPHNDSSDLHGPDDPAHVKPINTG
ncbi:hypothetical protein CVT24_001337 [Panaeolus cyanescens]|uniref:IMD domain-containing protein n=1 Tax=Panaeolus cyanescens TaxID=181874 RepID=A0A409WS07_9AGAR|nr:hypothetical protein CVT24_001337 [Panaeolus cyanescens]